MFYRSIYLILLWSCVGYFCINCSHIQKQSRPRVGVIIGAGGARAFSSIGVLKALQAEDISIDYLVGMGWGAWVAGVYSKNQSIDEVQWSLHKLFKRGFFKSSLLKGSYAKNIEDLSVDFKENFSHSDSQIPFSCPSIAQTGRVVWQSQTNLKRAVKHCLVVPPFFKLNSYVWGSIFSVRKAIDFLKEKKMDVILWIHSIEGGDLFPKKFSRDRSRFLWMSARAEISNIKIESNVKKINPDMDGFYLHDFSKINNIVLEGEKAGQKMVKALQKEYPQLNL